MDKVQKPILSIRFPFRRLLRLKGITVKLFLPASTRGEYNKLKLC
jgi:hypothetical protein